MNGTQTILVSLIFVTIIPVASGVNSAHSLGINISSEVNQNKTSDIELVGNVTKVVDGDTLDINGIRVRLSLVDTPEIGESGYESAKNFVKDLCLGNNAEVDIDDGPHDGT